MESTMTTPEGGAVAMTPTSDRLQRIEEEARYLARNFSAMRAMRRVAAYIHRPPLGGSEDERSAAFWMAVRERLVTILTKEDRQ